MPCYFAGKFDPWLARASSAASAGASTGWPRAFVEIKVGRLGRVLDDRGVNHLASKPGEINVTRLAARPCGWIEENLRADHASQLEQCQRKYRKSPVQSVTHRTRRNTGRGIPRQARRDVRSSAPSRLRRAMVKTISGSIAASLTA